MVDDPRSLGFAEHVGFSVWLIWSVSSAFLLAQGFEFTPQQLFLLVALPNLVGSLLRLPSARIAIVIGDMPPPLSDGAVGVLGPRGPFCMPLSTSSKPMVVSSA